MMGRAFKTSRFHEILLIGLAGIVLLLNPGRVTADLRTPTWYDPDGVGVGDDWHYRVPVAIASAATNSTVRVDVDFGVLLGQIGAAGTFDPNSPRVVRSNGVLCAIQQYTDSIYAGATDALANNRGEVRFLLEDNSPGNYYLYFDVLENGTKSPWNINNTINGNFEFSSNNQEDPPGWGATIYQSGYQAMAIASTLNYSVSDTSGSPSTISTDETANTGQYCYMLGARDNSEPAGLDPSTRLERTIAVPATDPGVIRIRYRVKGWDSSDNNFNDWDHIRIQIVTGGTTELVGPSAGNYTSLPFSPNFGRSNATNNRSGYGPYNYFDADLRRRHHSGMTITPGSEPWFTVTQDLTPWAGQTITLRIRTRHSTLYKSWFHIDDVEWSVVNAALGVPQLFGVNIITPNDTAAGPATIYYSGDTLMLRARMDAGASNVTVNLLDPAGSLIQGNILLFNDGSHGDAAAGDAIWTNDGSMSTQATYQFLGTDPSGTNWQVVVSAATGGSTATDTQVFTLIAPPDILLLKSVQTQSDPINGTINPKAIPGAFVTYTITAGNHGGSATDADTVVMTDQIPANTAFYTGDLGQPWGPVAFIDNPPLSGLTFNPATDLAFSMDGGSNFNLSTADLIGDANGCDNRITHIRVNPKGVLNGVSGSDVPEFTLQFRVRVQ